MFSTLLKKPTLLSEIKKFAEQARRVALLLLDFSAAYPSLARSFIFQVLSMSGLPANIVHALRELYKDNDHFYSFGGVYKFVFTVFSGVRQGCPLSSSIFAIVTDVLIRFIKSRITLDAFFRAYCDDYAFALKNPWRDFPTLCAVFSLVAKASALCLNIPKCKILPLWNFTIDNCKRILRDTCPSWHLMSIAFWAIYLGFPIGLHAHIHVWDKPVAKLVARVNAIRASGSGLAGSVFLYNTCAITVCSHMAQLFDSNPQVCEEINKAIKVLIPAPRNWITSSLLANLKLFLPFKSQVFDFGVWCMAVKMRVMFNTFKKWPAAIPDGFSSIPDLTRNAFPHYVLRRSFDRLIDNGILSSRGKFLNAEFEKAISALDSKMSIQSRAYNLLFSKQNNVQVVHEFINRLKKWRLPTILRRHPQHDDPLMDNVRRLNNILRKK